MKKNKPGIFFRIITADMAKQARFVELLSLFVFILLLLAVFWLWQFKVNLTVPGPAGSVQTIKLNVFEILLRKQ